MGTPKVFTSKRIKVPHGFLGRTGGISQGIFESLNCGYRHLNEGAGYDAKDLVDQNRASAVKAVGGNPLNLCLLKQVHGDVVHVITGPEQGKREGDALVTTTKGMALGVLTADCAPVLFYDPSSKIIAAAHAGWKGALKGVLERTIDKMEMLGAERKQIEAVIGPTIDQDSYEVGEDVYNQFLHHKTESCPFFKEGAIKGKYYFDLPHYAAHRLNIYGVESVEVLPVSTYKDEESFFSCRRAHHKGDPAFGNQLSLIFMND